MEPTTTQSAFFPDLDETSAPDGAREAIAGTRRAFGFVAAAMARMASSPTAVRAFGTLTALFDKTSLSKAEREVLILALAVDVGCHLCIALHGLEVVKHAGPEAAAAVKAGRPLADPRLEAVRRFTLAALAGKGQVDDAGLRAFFAAGFDARAALDAVVGIAAYTLSTYANRLTRAPVDAPLLKAAG